MRVRCLLEVHDVYTCGTPLITHFDLHIFSACAFLVTADLYFLVILESIQVFYSLQIDSRYSYNGVSFITNQENSRLIPITGDISNHLFRRNCIFWIRERVSVKAGLWTGLWTRLWTGLGLNFD